MLLPLLDFTIWDNDQLYAIVMAVAIILAVVVVVVILRLTRREDEARAKRLAATTRAPVPRTSGNRATKSTGASRSARAQATGHKTTATTTRQNRGRP